MAKNETDQPSAGTSPKTPSTRLRKSIRTPRPATSALFSVVAWMFEEKQRLSEGGPEPDPKLITRGWQHATSGANGGIALTIHEGHGAWTFDTAMAAFLQLANAVTGSIHLNAGNGKKPRHYAYLTVRAAKEDGGWVKRNIPIDRITMDAQAGQRVPDPEGDFHDRRARNLHLETGTRQDSPSKFYQGREEAIADISAGYDYEARHRKLPLDRDSFEAFLRIALDLHDRRRPKPS